MTKKQEQKTGKNKHPGGRPSEYKPEYVDVAGKLCRERGYTVKNLATHFKISACTIYAWKRGYPEFSESIRRGKDDFDVREVEQSLLKRAMGYSYDEITQELGEDGEMIVTKIVTKQIAPSDVAIVFHLKNRNPARWSDKKEIDHRIEELAAPRSDEEILKELLETKEAGNGIDWRSINGGCTVHKIG